MTKFIDDFNEWNKRIVDREYKKMRMQEKYGTVLENGATVEELQAKDPTLSFKEESEILHELKEEADEQRAMNEAFLRGFTTATRDNCYIPKDSNADQ